MLPGPVFNVELLTSSRRPRYYALRVVYGLALLVLIWQNYSHWDRYNGSVLAPQQMTQFARTTFSSILILQGVVVLSMTCSLCAGVIANEKQRKTLHYLLASTLTSPEIILGKLMARMLHVAVFLAIGLPVMSMLSLFGGVDPLFALLATLGSLSTAFALACMAVLCSTLAKRVREAISMAYLLEGAWLALPLLARTALPYSYPEFYTWVRPLNDWLFAATPWGPLQASTSLGSSMTAWPLIEATLWMMGLQLGAGAAFLGLAVWRLRPVFKAQEGSTSTRFLGIPLPGRKTGRFRLFGRRSLGDRAMIWKELFTSRTSGAAQVAGIVIGGLIVCVVGYWTYQFGSEAVWESWANPNDPSLDGNLSYRYADGFRKRTEFNFFLRYLTTAVEVVCILAAAVGGANCLTCEREDDTWISLIATPMDGREIVGAKMLGVLWKLRWAIGLVAVEWVVGTLCGAVHPVGLLFQLVEFVVFVCFATALGTYFSLVSKSTWRSQSTTMGLLVMCSGGYLACCCPMMTSGRSGTILYAAGCMPMILGVSLMSPMEYTDVFVRGQTGSYGPNGIGELILMCIVGTVFYAVMAFTLSVAAFAGFDKAAGRPRRDADAPPPPPAKQKPAPEVG